MSVMSDLYTTLEVVYRVTAPARVARSSRIDQEHEGKDEEHDELNTQITQYNPVCSRWPEPLYRYYQERERERERERDEVESQSERSV
jgi:hypothetical protein